MHLAHQKRVWPVNRKFSQVLRKRHTFWKNWQKFQKNWQKFQTFLSWKKDSSYIHRTIPGVFLRYVENQHGSFNKVSLTRLILWFSITRFQVATVRLLALSVMCVTTWLARVTASHMSRVCCVTDANRTPSITQSLAVFLVTVIMMAQLICSVTW